MSILQSRNPAMGVFEQARDERLAHSDARYMSIGGTVTATAILLSILITVAMLVYAPLAKGLTDAVAANTPYSMPGWVYPVVIANFIGGIVISLVIYSKPQSARFIAPLHAAFQGVFVGAVSFIIPVRFIGEASAPMVMQAMLATFAITGTMLLGYATGVLRVGPLFQKIIITITAGLIVYVMALFLSQFIGFNLWNGYADTGMMGIGFTGLCIALASLFLLMDFQFIEKGVENRAPKYMEWVGAWGLMVTLVWLYIEVLRMLAKLNSRD